MIWLQSRMTILLVHQLDKHMVDLIIKKEKRAKMVMLKCTYGTCIIVGDDSKEAIFYNTRTMS